MATEPVSDADLSVHYCLKSIDRVQGDPETTAFKRRARLHQALWREARGLEMGTNPVKPSPLGNMLVADEARKSGANFLNDKIRQVVRERLANPQEHQMLDEERLYCNLLSSMPMCFNLFGILQTDLEMADQAVHAWWPDVPGRVSAVHFEWSPGRALPGQYLENRTSFDVAFELELENGGHGILGIETKYHENCKPEKSPNEEQQRRYTEVTNKSGVLSSESMLGILGADLQQIWLDHLLALSMLQHESRKWNWARFVLVHPAKNPSYARAAERYRQLLKNSETFHVTTLESLLAASILPKEIASAFRKRYLW